MQRNGTIYSVMVQRVNDFHTLEKEKIFTLYHIAIQEIDKQQQIDKQNITTLQNEVTTPQIKILH